MFNIREIKENEIDILLDLIYEMASYEKLTSDVTATKESLEKVIFKEKTALVRLLEIDDKIIGYLMYFYNVSSFTGSRNLYIEDIFVKEEYRRNGFGKKCFIYLAKEAMKEDIKRIDWICLDWNQKSLDFYKKMGANKLDMWCLHRLDREGIMNLAKEDI